MNITDFSQHSELKKTLLAAYILGRKDEALNISPEYTTESF